MITVIRILAVGIGLILSNLMLNARSVLREDQKFVLITVLYNEQSEARRREYLACLLRNIEHDAISHIHIIYDITKDTKGSGFLDVLPRNKVSITPYDGGRPTYEYCFRIANKLYRGRNIILANADIFFDETLYELVGRDLTNYFLALTRWNIQEDGTLQPFLTEGTKPVTCSQDAWFFKSPIKLFDGSRNIKLGMQHCDGQIAYYARKTGLIVRNPCKTVRCCHLHLSQIRHYVANNPPPYRTMIRLKWETVADVFE